MSAVIKHLYPDFQPTRLKLAEHMRVIYHATVEPSVKREDLVKSEFWKHVAPKLQPYTRIEVVTDDGQYYVELMVLASGRNWATVKEINFVDLSGQDKITDTHQDDFFVKHNGPHDKWCIFRRSDNEKIQSKMEKDQANTALVEYLKVISK